MNRKQTRTTLKVEFKQFQRLPDWPSILRAMDADGIRGDVSVPKAELAALVQQNRSGIRTFAE